MIVLIQKLTVYKFIYISFFLILSHAVTADSANKVQVLKSMMPTSCEFSGEFVQTKQIKTLPIPLISNGKFLYSCDLGLIWQTQKPINESLVFSKQKLHFLVPEKSPVENLDGVQHDFLANLLLNLMSGNTDFIMDEFEISNINDQQNNLTLIPKNKMVKQAIQSVTLESQESKSGLTITITDKNLQENKIVSNEKQKYKNNDEFTEQCLSMLSKSCKLLLNPVRVSSGGKN